MTFLIPGLLLWAFAHYFKRLMPARRAAMGEKGKGVIALVLVASVILMVIGYRNAPFVPVWNPPAFLNGINNLAMLLAFWIFGSSAAKGAKAWPAYKTRHPQLLAVKIWAAAHLLVNGDMASIILFGGMLLWAVSEVIIINRSEPNWTPPPHAGRKTYIRLAVISLVLFSITAGIHIALGVNPFS